MSNIENVRISAFRPASGLLGAAAAARVTATPVFVDVSEAATKAEVTRGGFSVGEIAVRPDVLADVLDIRPVIRTKVVSQSIAAGTAVARGTAIDIVLTRTDDLPLTIIPGVHQAFTDLTIGNVFSQFEGNTTVRDIIRRRTDPTQLTSDERTQLTTALDANGIQIGTEPTNDLQSAFTALQAVFTFQG